MSPQNRAIGVAVDYRLTGSGIGIQWIMSGAVGFAATDMQLAPEDLAANHLVQFPPVDGAVVPFFILPGIEAGTLTLDGPKLTGVTGLIRISV